MQEGPKKVARGDQELSTPEAVGLSSDRLKRIESFIKTKYIDTGKLPCALTQVWRRGQLAYTSVLGSADVERGKPLADDSLFRIYSMTKPITSVAFMMLVEDGLVALDDPVHRFIPAWRDLGVFAGGVAGAFQTKRATEPMRVLDLLRHTSGLTYGFQQRTNVDAAYRKLKLDGVDSEGGLRGFIDSLGTVPLEFSPGEAWNYSVSTDVLGYLVELISGMPFDVFLKTRIFDPLKMVDTGFFVPEDQRDRFTACYALTPSGKVVLQDDPEKSHFLKDPSVKSGGGGLVSTADDYMRFCRMLLNGGELDGARLLSPKTIKLMTMNHLPGAKELVQSSRSLFSEAVFEGLGFGLGFAMTLDQARTTNLGSLGD
jgi:CubicO group peptidase (beta-lactamase class C family)